MGVAASDVLWVVLIAAGALLAVGALAFSLRHRMIEAAVWALFRDGDVAEARRWLARVPRLGLSPSAQRTIETLEIQCCEVEGNTARALELARAAVPWVRRDLSFANTLANAFINGGAYREALELGEGWTAPEGLSLKWLVEWRLLQINLAEAEYNLGRWDAAWARIHSIDPEREPSPLISNAVRLQRAWILARTGKGEEAVATIEELDPKSIPPLYWAEIHFTRAAARMARGQLAEARAELEAAAAVARRASSRRNLLFMRAQLLRLEGRREEAASLCEQAASHAYRGQGGDGLLLWGDLLEELGRLEEARHAWRLAIERDPQSEATRVARERLQERGAGDSHAPSP